MPTSRTSTTTSTSSRSASRASSSARNAIIEMLKEDHRRVKKAFRQFEKLDEHQDPEECAALVKQTCSELEVHATLEEELFYPAARSCLGEDDLLDEAEVEHASVKSLIGQIKAMKPGDEKFGAIFTVIGEYVKHHVKEEEQEMFPQLSNARFDWKQLQEQMTERRQALMSEIEGKPDESAAGMAMGDAVGEEEDIAPEKEAAAAKGRKDSAAKGKRKSNPSASADAGQEEGEDDEA